MYSYEAFDWTKTICLTVYLFIFVIYDININVYISIRASRTHILLTDSAHAALHYRLGQGLQLFALQYTHTSQPQTALCSNTSLPDVILLPENKKITYERVCYEAMVTRVPYFGGMKLTYTNITAVILYWPLTWPSSRGCLYVSSMDSNGVCPCCTNSVALCLPSNSHNACKTAALHLLTSSF